ncbi:hypothetical protein TWF106_004854 [Orbilia oligospora]|uniref:F-box domain-containing protein n=1 Tax=Orbilia oligospora TaxID=2813651 RepID=A0A6G1MDJ8_ORBOL|nr:hypothetical protein TWF106_004854 [Orbilia oligospora]KAF3225276.1 hypothetical protein TWF191_005326 [Orbilia oligospora]KAF3254521.1 hypothetical protein TWF192_003283 [Orbilia oligospora]
MDSSSPDLHRAKNILNLPPEILRMVFAYLGDNEYKQSISLTCFEFYSLALQSRYESISIEFDVRGFKWKPFASSLLLEPVRGQKRYPKALRFIPSQAFEEKRKDSKYTVKDLKRSFARRGNICFDAVKSITFLNPKFCLDYTQRHGAAKEIFDDSFAGLAFEVLKRFPNLVNLTIPITHAILTRKVRIGKTRNASKNREKNGILANSKLRYLCCLVSLPRKEFSAVWELIRSNSNTLKFLRIFFLFWSPEICALSGEIKVPYLFTLDEYLSKLSTLFTIREYFPPGMPPARLSLKALQFESFPCCGSLQCSNLFRPDVLEVLSLVYCHDAYAMLCDTSVKLVSLRCLQVVEIKSDVSMLERSLSQLRPLEGLYISIIQKDEEFDYRCLEKHKGSIKRLVFLTGEKAISRGDSHLKLRSSSPRTIKPDFREWQKLEELTFHCGEPLPAFYIPPCLKFLSVVGASAGVENSTNSDYELARGYASQQIMTAEGGERRLMAIIFNERLSLPNDIGYHFKIFEIFTEKTGESSGRYISTPIVKILGADDFLRKFPATSILRPSRKARTWIDAFI